MQKKDAVIAELREELTRWEKVIPAIRTKQETISRLPLHLAIKDVLAHLMAWQLISISRLTAALENKEPEYPDWPTEDPDSRRDLDYINNINYEKYRHESFDVVYKKWHDGFQKFLDLARLIKPTDMFDEKKYSWLNGYDLYAVLKGSLDHHKEHMEHLDNWLKQGK
jgi:hypothetical protein